MRSNPRSEVMLRNALSSKARQLITAGSAEEQVIEAAEYNHSAFTFALLDALGEGTADGNNDGIITALELATNLTREITRLIPLDDSFSALLTSKNSHMALPSGDDVIVMDDRPGVDYLGVLYSKQELDLDSLINEMHRLPGSLYERLNAALGDAVIPQSDISFDADGRLAFEADGTTFRASLPNSDTLSVLHIYATDRAGDEARERFVIALRKEDRLPPDITLSAPMVRRAAVAGIELVADTLTVRGSVVDRGEVVAIYVNGVKAELGYGGAFSVNVPIVDGSTEIAVKAHDAAGNMSSEKWYVADEDLVASRAAATTEEAFVLFDVFYATDRVPTGRTSPRSFYGGKPGDLSHGIAEVSIPKTHQVGELESPTWWRLDATPDPSRHIMLQSLKPMDEGALIKEMRAEIEKSTGKSAFVYVHGYNTEFEETARRTAQMAYDLSFDGIAAMYSWPSDGTFLGYASDEIDVERAVEYLERYLNLIVEDSGADQVHVLAHSMGNRALTQALMRIADEQAEPVFTEIILAAPDIDADLFRNEIAPVIQQTADRVTLYASANDKALMTSEKIHVGRRIGDSSGGIVIIDGIETVDVSGVDTALLGLGHSYFAQTRAVLSDLVKVVGMRLAADQRELIPRIVAELRYCALGTE